MTTIIRITLVDDTELFTHYLRIGTLGDIHTDSTIICPTIIKSVEIVTKPNQITK